MKRLRTMGIFLSLVLTVGLLAGTLPIAQVAAATLTPTTELTVTRYATDGTTILDQITIDYATMESTLGGLLPVQGDGETHYYMQGPTFDPANLLDPAETLNLKDKGAVKGTDVKDLCDLVGGAAVGADVRLVCSDGYGETFHYDDVYNPEPEQGKFVICWYTKGALDEDTGAVLYPDGAYVPDFNFGMRLVFMPDDHIFGNQNMEDCLPEDNWHTYTDGTTVYPSVNGLSLKCVSEIDIYPEPAPQWSIEVTGIVDQPVDQGWFENALSCHETQSWTDGSGNEWSGLPLWYLCGLSDDTIVHGPGAFNDAVAAAGYTVEVRSDLDPEDPYARTFASADVARSNGYIIANQKNGMPLSEADGYPLKLVGSAITSGGDRVKNITSINLLDVPILDTWTVQLSGASEYTMTQTEFESGVLCEHAVTYTDGDDTYSGMSLWLLCGWVDDNVQHGEGAFNDALATTPPGYQVKVSAIAPEGETPYSYTFGSADVARNDSIIVANKLNGEDLPDSEYPLRIVGDFLPSGGWKVRQIASIELLNLPTPAYTLTVNTIGSGTVTVDPDQTTYPAGTEVTLTAVPAAGSEFVEWSGDLTGMDNPATITMDGNKTVTATFNELQWNLQLNGMDQYTMTQSEFEALAAAYPLSCVVTNKDGSQDTYTGTAMWRLVGKVDDGDDTTMNSDYAALDYDISMIASDGFTKSLASSEVLNNDTYIVANMMNGAPLPADKFPLRVVWEGTTSGKMVSMLATIQLAIPWDLELVGASTYVMPNTEFEAAAAVNPASWVDGTDTWEGLALWRLVGIVDDDDPTTFNDTLASIGYTVKIVAADGYNKTFSSSEIARNDSRIIANIFNDYTLPPSRFPLRHVGPGLSGSLKVSQIVRIELLDLPTLMEFSVDSMVINFTWLRPYTEDTILASGSFSLPEDVTYDLDSDDVSVNVDGVEITIPAGSFRKLLRRREIYTYNSPWRSSPDVLMSLNFETGAWSLWARDVDASVVDNYDGIDVMLSIGSTVGTEHIEMRIDSLSY